MSDSSMLPNPVVYLNYLTPELAFAWELTRDVYLVTCGALIWDILSSIPRDMSFFQRIDAGVLAYGLCRPAALGLILGSVISMTSPVRSCEAMALGTSCSSMVATGASSFLFLRRVQAVYSHSKLVRYAFFVLWLVQVGLSVFIPLGSPMGPLYDTGYCITTGVKRQFDVVATLMPIIFDTLVFGFISYQVVTTHANDSNHSHSRTFFLGKALPQLSKAMLQGGQKYYLLTVGMNVALAALIGFPSTPKIFQTILVIPTFALTSVMACKVQRDLFNGRQGTGQETETIESSGLHFAAIANFLTRSYRSERGPSNNEHGEHNNISNIKTSQAAVIDYAV